MRWEDIRKKARVKKGHRSTLLKAFCRGKILVAARRPRENPHRTPEHKAERYELTKMFINKGPGHYVKDLDMIIDNKEFDIPTTQRARQSMKSQHVRFHLCMPSEGLQEIVARSRRKKNRMNTGGEASVCAGTSNGTTVVWHH